MKKINTIIFLMTVAFILSSCDDFLSQRPSKESAIVPSTLEDIELILVGTWREDCSSDHVTYGGGDIQLLPELEAAANGSGCQTGLYHGPGRGRDQTAERGHGQCLRTLLWASSSPAIPLSTSWTPEQRYSLLFCISSACFRPRAG